MLRETVKDPLKFAKLNWPDISFYKEQIAIIRSIQENDETWVRAGNMLGKDFVAGFIALWFFVAHQPVRIVSTSVKDDHLRVLWGEIGRFIQHARYPLTVDKGGFLVFNHREIRKVWNGETEKISYCVGMVSEKGEGLAGHHARHTLAILDEASGIENTAYEQMATWADKFLIFGNPNNCDNFFRKGNDAGDLKDLERPGRYYRKVFRIRAEDSPNVRRAIHQKSLGQEPDRKEIVPGVLSYDDYVKRRATLDPVRQCVSLDAEFYVGPGVLLFPPEWLTLAEKRAAEITGLRRAKAIGIDPGEGVANTAYAVVDEYGLIELLSIRTQDTSQINGILLDLAGKYKVDSEYWIFDRGGGGKQHADRLRNDGYKPRTVAFGESLTPDIRKGMIRYKPYVKKIDEKEVRYYYKNRRAQMYGEFSALLDPSLNPESFGLPAQYSELRRQLAIMPKLYDNEGRIVLPPKNRNPGQEETKFKTLSEMLGCSPDEADSLVLAVHGMLHKPQVMRAGVMA